MCIRDRGMPDIDVDFCQNRRDEVIEYVKNRYGPEYVSQITTFGNMKAKAVIRDVGRVLGMSYADVAVSYTHLTLPTISSV